LIDDSVSVLKAARDFGIGSTVGISRPDSRFSSREIEGFLAVEGVKELID
jgi:hypothetical protein